MDHQSRGGSWNLVPSASQTLIQDEQQRFHSLPSQLHLLPIIENLADAIEGGTRDQHSDALVSELSTQFDKCRQLLNSISASVNVKAMTVEGQKRKLEEYERQLNQRRELIAEYRRSVEEFTKSDCNR